WRRLHRARRGQRVRASSVRGWADRPPRLLLDSVRSPARNPDAGEGSVRSTLPAAGDGASRLLCGAADPGARGSVVYGDPRDGGVLVPAGPGRLHAPARAAATCGRGGRGGYRREGVAGPRAAVAAVTQCGSF